MNQCRSCGAAIIWANTVRGKRMPLNAEPAELGNVSISSGVVRFVFPDRNATGPRYTSHFTTCPEARLRRRRNEPGDIDDREADAGHDEMGKPL